MLDEGEANAKKIPFFLMPRGNPVISTLGLPHPLAGRQGRGVERHILRQVELLEGYPLPCNDSDNTTSSHIFWAVCHLIRKTYSLH